MNRTGTWARRAVWATLVGVLCIGCNPLQTVAFFLHKDDKVPAEFPLRPKEGAKSDKDQELKVLVLCEMKMGGDVPAEFVGANRELTTIVAKHLPEEAKANKEKFAVIPPTQVDKFKMANPNWRAMHPVAIGKKLGADYVLDVTLTNIRVYQPGSGNMVYEGRAEVFVDVYDVAAPAGEPKYKYPYPFMYPKTGMIAADEMPISRFKTAFLERLAVELIRKHVEHRPADSIAEQ